MASFRSFGAPYTSASLFQCTTSPTTAAASVALALVPPSTLRNNSRRRQQLLVRRQRQHLPLPVAGRSVFHEQLHHHPWNRHFSQPNNDAGAVPSSGDAVALETESRNEIADDASTQEWTTSNSLRRKLGLAVVEENASSRTTTAARGGVAVVGHRGALYAHLENTRPSFLRCAEWGCHAVELDVFVLKDGAVVVFHGGGSDETPGLLADYCLSMKDDDDDDDRNSSRSILDLTFAETQDLQFNAAFAEFPCPPAAIAAAKIPTLEQVLTDLAPYPSVEIKIELKGPGVVQPVLEIVERLHMEQQCSYSSFAVAQLRELRALRPDRGLYRTGALFGAPPADYLRAAQHGAGATEVHLVYDECSVERVRAIHAAGLRSLAWLRGPVGMGREPYLDVGDEDAACYQALIDTGVQQICCNKPDLLLQILRERDAAAA